MFFYGWMSCIYQLLLPTWVSCLVTWSESLLWVWCVFECRLSELDYKCITYWSLTPYIWNIARLHCGKYTSNLSYVELFLNTILSSKTSFFLFLYNTISNFSMRRGITWFLNIVTTDQSCAQLMITFNFKTPDFKHVYLCVGAFVSQMMLQTAVLVSCIDVARFAVL